MTTTPHENVMRQAITWQELQQMEIGRQSSFTLHLADGESFFAERIVRIVPQRRLVAFGYWHDKPVVAKIFFSSHAKKHRAIEITSIKRLIAANIPTPAILYDGETADGRVQLIILQRIFAADNLYDLWQQSAEKLPACLRKVVLELATQHVLGILQKDLHFKNFLITENKIYTLDAAQIEYYSPLLPKDMCLTNLALFFAQLGIGQTEVQNELFALYVKARGWIINSDDEKKLHQFITKWNKVRWENYANKIQRNSTDFISKKNWQKKYCVRRDAYLPQLQTFLTDPDRVFQHPTMELLKAGRSSSVIKVTLDHRDYVIKRYNIKNYWHFLRRCLRPTRAVKNWRLGNKLALFGVATPQPIAYLETRHLGLRGKSYYVNQYIAGKNLKTYIEEERDVHCLDKLIQNVVMLLKNLREINIAHGDLKSTNILLDKNQHPFLIDLDGAREFLTTSGLRRAWQAEICRFLANFSHLPSIVAKFRKAF